MVEGRQLRLQAAVRVLRAADEAHAGQAEAVLVQRAVRGVAQARVVGEPQVVVRACAAPRGAVGCCCCWPAAQQDPNFCTCTQTPYT